MLSKRPDPSAKHLRTGSASSRPLTPASPRSFSPFDDDDDAQYLTAPESPHPHFSGLPSRAGSPGSQFRMPMIFVPKINKPPRKIATTYTPPTPPSPARALTNMTFTSTDILNTLSADASAPVPFPYTVQFPSPPPTPPAPDSPVQLARTLEAKKQGGTPARSKLATMLTPRPHVSPFEIPSSKPGDVTPPPVPRAPPPSPVTKGPSHKHMRLQKHKPQKHKPLPAAAFDPAPAPAPKSSPALKTLRELSAPKAPRPSSIATACGTALTVGAALVAEPIPPEPEKEKVGKRARMITLLTGGKAKKAPPSPVKKDEAPSPVQEDSAAREKRRSATLTRLGADRKLWPTVALAPAPSPPSPATPITPTPQAEPVLFPDVPLIHNSALGLEMGVEIDSATPCSRPYHYTRRSSLSLDLPLPPFSATASVASGASTPWASSVTLDRLPFLFGRSRAPSITSEPGPRTLGMGWAGTSTPSLNMIVGSGMAARRTRRGGRRTSEDGLGKMGFFGAPGRKLQKGSHRRTQSEPLTLARFERLSHDRDSLSPAPTPTPTPTAESGDVVLRVVEQLRAAAHTETVERRVSAVGVVEEWRGGLSRRDSMSSAYSSERGG